MALIKEGKEEGWACLLYSTLYTVCCVLYTVYCILYIVYCMMYTVYCILYVDCMPYNVQKTVYVAHDTVNMYSKQT